MTAADNRWRQERSRLRSILRAIELDNVTLASRLLAQAEAQAFERGDSLAGEYAFVRYHLGGQDRKGAAELVRRILERRYR